MSAAPNDSLVQCDACPVRCRIKLDRAGACDRYANFNGELGRVDPLTIVERAKAGGTKLIPFLKKEKEWSGDIVSSDQHFITAVGAGTTFTTSSSGSETRVTPLGSWI